MFTIFFFIMFCINIKEFSDLWGHSIVTKSMLDDNRLISGNFLMYFLANLLSVFSGNIIAIRYAIIFLISCAETTKFVLIKNYFHSFVSDRKARWCSIALLFVYIVPFLYFFRSSGMYIGYCVPNVWHNSTIIVSMPFVILMYFTSIKQFENFDIQRNVSLTIATILCVFVKPSFFFVFTVAYPLLLLWKYGFKKNFFVGLIPILTGLLCVFYEFLTIYEVSPDDSSVIFNFNKLISVGFWKRQAPYVISSLSFPILYVALNFKKTIYDKEFWYILTMVFFSILISLVCEETGPRAGHGNFSWQIIPSMWFTFFYILKHIIVIEGEPIIEVRKKQGLCVLFFIHTVIGIWFLIRYLVLNTYY